MPPENGALARSHSLLLLQKLLNLRDAVTPLTLILDNLEQPAQPLLHEFISRATISKAKVILLSFTTIKKPQDVDVIVKAAGKDLRLVTEDLVAHYPKLDAERETERSAQRVVIVIDSLNRLASAAASRTSGFLGGILAPAVSIVAVYHTDVPVVPPRSSNEYEPHPLTILSHQASAILRLSSLAQETERKRARDRAVQEPEWGLKEGREGVVIGLITSSGAGSGAEDAGSTRDAGVVIDMELRRKSGRRVADRFVLLRSQDGATAGAAAPRLGPGLGLGKLMLLADHPVFAKPQDDDDGPPGEGGGGEPVSTFSLGLTEKQKKDREGIVLPYFDAQTDIGSGEGGRILYEMGREDDFDDEEDEI
ncbi:uncharacterized protein UV8b_06753 [Ustilaginoidea virens]|uniref:Elongator complex protein 5 n=1 Tax=Ustilaginoidea virens TaxID=1159556 RepID=A0A8E5HW15_USTVR|nr:uncharacterized protein UV8b_06753 [Ustilaginoidea virens]QUC22512.1 hypothetical protein UV8b_06753 [Ustilaginoidea virens]